MKRTLIPFLIISSLVVLPFYASSQQATVTDQETGRTVLLENLEGMTRVTDLESGESILVEGEFAEAMTDEKYTNLMRLDRLQESAEKGRIQEAKAAVVTVSSSFSFKTEIESKNRYPLSAGTVYLSITKATTSRPRGDVFQVTLYRDISFWPDESFGAKSFSASNQGKSGSTTWKVTKNANYYLKFSRKPVDSYFITGFFELRG